MKKKIIYGYEKISCAGYVMYPMYPAISKGKIIPAYIIGNGYVYASSGYYLSRDDCMKLCDTYNRYFGWSQKEIKQIYHNFISGKYESNKTL